MCRAVAMWWISASGLQETVECANIHVPYIVAFLLFCTSGTRDLIHVSSMLNSVAPEGPKVY